MAALAELTSKMLSVDKLVGGVQNLKDNLTSAPSYLFCKHAAFAALLLRHDRGARPETHTSHDPPSLFCMPRSVICLVQLIMLLIGVLIGLHSAECTVLMPSGAVVVDCTCAQT